MILKIKFKFKLFEAHKSIQDELLIVANRAITKNEAIKFIKRFYVHEKIKNFNPIQLEILKIKEVKKWKVYGKLENGSAECRKL